MGSLTTNGAGELLQFDATGKLPGDINIDGHTFTFTGSGAGLTDLPGGNITPGTVGLAALDAMGTPSATPFLRGDDTWATAVTSVGLSVDPVLGTVSGSPVTESGTLAIAAPVMAAGTFIAGPVATSGAAVARTIAASDIYAILSAAMDTAFGSTQGDLLQRTATGWAVLAPGTAGQVLQTNGAGANAAWSDGGATVQVPVRQTALSGATNATGQANFITTGSGLQPGVATGAGVSPLTLAFANGFGATGGVDYVEQITADRATYWSALPANNLSHLAISRTGVGSISPAATLAPPQVSYAYQGRYNSGWITPLPPITTTVVENHNIGDTDIVTVFKVKCLTADFAHSVGEVVYDLNTNSGVVSPIPKIVTNKTVNITTGNGYAIGLINKSTGGNTSITTASWAYALTAQRNW